LRGWAGSLPLTTLGASIFHPQRHLNHPETRSRGGRCIKHGVESSPLTSSSVRNKVMAFVFSPFGRTSSSRGPRGGECRRGGAVSHISRVRRPHRSAGRLAAAVAAASAVSLSVFHFVSSQSRESFRLIAVASPRRPSQATDLTSGVDASM